MIPDIHAIENRAEKSMQNLLVFRLGTQAYALSIEVVVQIIPMMKLTPLPQTDAVIEGVVNIRGTITPIMNVRRRLGMQPIPARLHTPIILIRLGNHLVGLVVDEVIDILSLPAGQIARPDQILPQGLEVSKVLDGVIFLDSHNILLLNPYMLVTPASTLMRNNTANPPEDSLPGFPQAASAQPAKDSLILSSDDFELVFDEPTDSEKARMSAASQTEAASKPPEKPKTRKRSRTTSTRAEKVLAEQVATLAVDFVPVDGTDEEPSKSNPSQEETPKTDTK